MDNEKDLAAILKAYRMHPMEIVDNKNDTYVIREEERNFMLHKASMDQAQITLWESVFHQANEHNIHSILPVYPADDGGLFVERRESLFYLTPHIETTEKINITNLFKTIATIHKKTNRTFIIQKQALIQSFKLYEEELKSKRTYLRQTIDLFEQQEYMSPLELQVCSHFHIVEDVFEKSFEHVSSLIEICEKDENAHIEWSSSLCHNRLSTEYVLEQQVQYIKNWEKASIANPTADVALLCKNEFLRNEYPLAPFIQGLIEYNKLYVLSELEEHMLAIHLLHPLTYIDALQSYNSERGEKSVIYSVMKLERIFRVLACSFYLLYEYEQQKPNMFSGEID